MSWYGIHYIQISPYNSQANGVVKQRHYNVQEAIVKSTMGGEICWSATAHSVFWAECITVLKSTGLLPYFMVHSVKPLFPFDVSEATFLVPVPDTDDITTPILITWQAHQLQKHREDIDIICEWVLLSQFAPLRHFDQQFKNQIHQQDFSPGDLVLVHNSRIEKELIQKMKLATRPNGGPLQVYWRITCWLSWMVQFHAYDMQPFGCCFTIHAHISLYQLWT